MASVPSDRRSRGVACRGYYPDFRHGVQEIAKPRGEGTPTGALDTLIAAHALSADCVLVTNNEREFRRVPQLRVENWLAR